MTRYRETNPKVSISPIPGDVEPICVAFGDINLMLTINIASWLAENIQRAIRNMERAEREKAIPLTAEQRRQLQPGDEVLVRMDHGHPVGDTFYTVKQSPWQLGHGDWVIGLDGISGGYDLSRALAIKSTVHSRGPSPDLAAEAKERR